MEGKDDFINTLRGKQAPAPPPVFKKRSESFRWMVVALIGIFVIFVGAIWVSMASWSPPPNSADYSSYQDYAKDLRAWKNFTKSGNLYGRIVMEIGAFALTMGGFLGYIDSTVDPEEKKYMIIIGIFGLIALILLSVGITEISPYVGT